MDKAMDDFLGEFLAETGEALDAIDAALLALERDPRAAEPIRAVFRLMHTIKGTSGFLGLDRLGKLTHVAEDLLGKVRDGLRLADRPVLDAVFAAVDRVKNIVAAVAAAGHEPDGSDADLIARLKALLNDAPAETPAAVAAATAEMDGDLSAALGGPSGLDTLCELTIGLWAGQGRVSTEAALAGQFVLFERLCNVAAGPVGAPPPALQELIASDSPGLEKALRQAGRQIELPDAAIATLIARMLPATPANLPVAAPAAVAATEPVAPEPGAKPRDETLRVNVAVLERMMTSVSEMVLLRNQLLQLARHNPDSEFSPPINRLNQVTSDLQENVMAARMQPIGSAWAKLPRIVRDVARELGKEVDLVMSGEETELDRQVIECIRDPLTHMIRNAVDHGIEDPATRRAAGKPTAGRITLSARHEGGAVVIEIADDGKGIPVARLRAKALEKGLVSPAELNTMSDDKVRELIFHPGFSTAEQVTSLSGRGVGMDVVRTNVDAIGGAVEVHSQEGAGSRFTVRIPLTLAIVSSLIVEAAEQRYALPVSAVLEIVTAGGSSRHRIERLGAAAVLRLRERLLPLVELRATLGLDAQAVEEESSVVVLNVAGREMGIIVDRVHDIEEIVVKPVARILRSLSIFAGSTILGDGAVVMILDLNGLLSHLPDVKARAAEETKREVATTATEQVLLFRSAGAIRAVQLAAVARLEEVEAGKIETSAGRPVLNYFGAILPLVDASGAGAGAGADAARRPVLVMHTGGRQFGVVVDEIIDLADAACWEGRAANYDGVVDAQLIHDRVTDIVDPDHFAAMAFAA